MSETTISCASSRLKEWTLNILVCISFGPERLSVGRTNGRYSVSRGTNMPKAVSRTAGGSRSLLGVCEIFGAK